MTLRWRYLLAIVPLFLGLGVANALVLYFLEKKEVIWGLEQQAMGAVLTLAAFAGPATATGQLPPPEFHASFEQFARRMRGMSAAWFVETADGWRATHQIETAGILPPAVPDAAMVAAVGRHESAARPVARPEAPVDEAVGYAGVFAEGDRLRAIIGVSIPESELRAQEGGWKTEGGVLIALLGLLGWGIAEALTQLAQREINRLQAVGDALSRGNFAAEWTPGRIGELNDLGGTLRTMASLLRDSVHRTRRKLLQFDLFPRDHELATLWQAAWDDVPDLATPHDWVLLRRVGARHPDDFFGQRETPGHWVAVAGRLDPASGATAISRLLQSTTARDYFLGLATSVAAGGASPAGPFLFSVRHLNLLVIPKDGRPAAWLTATGGGAALATQSPPVTRGVAGTLSPEARQFVADFLFPFPPAELPLRADELGGLLAGRGDGVLLIFVQGDRSPLRP